MEIGKLISALDETLILLRRSESSAYASISVDEIIEKLESELTKAKGSLPIDSKILSFLFAPTGAIQETAIANGWENEFLRISRIIDQFAGNND